VAPTLALALLAAPIIGVAELVTTMTTYIAWQIGTALFVGILSSATVEIGARNYDEKMRELNGHLVWTTQATGKDAEPTWMQQRDIWVKFLPETDWVFVSTSRLAFGQPSIPETTPERPVNRLPVKDPDPRPINLVGYKVQYRVKDETSNLSEADPYYYGTPMGWGGETEEDMEKYEQLIQDIWDSDEAGPNLDKQVFHQTSSWAMSQQISIKSEFEFYRNDNLHDGVPPAPIDDLSEPGATSTFPLRLRYEIVKVGYGVWDDRNNDGIEEWYDEIFYGEWVATVDEPVEMLSYKDCSRRVIPDEQVGDSQGIDVTTVDVSSKATRHLKKVKKFKCKFMNMGDDGKMRLRDVDREVRNQLYNANAKNHEYDRLKCGIPEGPLRPWALWGHPTIRYHRFRECGGVSPGFFETNEEANLIKTELVVVQKHTYTPPAGKQIKRIGNN